MRVKKAAIVETLTVMNWHFGKGDIKSVNVARGIVVVKCPHAGEYKYKFRFDRFTGTVSYRGRKRKVA
jgi:hypothetical protein